MTFYICRVNANDLDEAREEITKELRKSGLQPAGELRPTLAPVQYGEGPLWDCVAQCEAAA